MSMRGMMERYGSRVTFTWATAGTYDPATDTTTGDGTAEAPGLAAKVRGNPDTYTRLQLVESDNPTLQFLPDVAGNIPPLGATVVFGDETLRAQDIDALVIKGVAEAAKIIVSR